MSQTRDTHCAAVADVLRSVGGTCDLTRADIFTCVVTAHQC